jgi:hypothetical protein
MTKKDLLQQETAVFAALEFGLHLQPHEFLPHITRILEATGRTSIDDRGTAAFPVRPGVRGDPMAAAGPAEDGGGMRRSTLVGNGTWYGRTAAALEPSLERNTGPSEEREEQLPSHNDGGLPSDERNGLPMRPAGEVLRLPGSRLDGL